VGAVRLAVGFASVPVGRGVDLSVGIVGLAIGVVPAIPVAHRPLMAVRWLVRGVSGVKLAVGVVGLAIGVVAIPVHGALILVGVVGRFVVVLVLITVIIIVMFNLVCGLVLVSGLVVVLFVHPIGRFLVFLVVLWFVLVGLGVGDLLLPVAVVVLIV